MNTPRKHDFDDELRAVLGSVEDTDFDYDALIAGTKARAGRIRRRRALAQGVTAAVLVPTLVATGWLVGNGLRGSTDPGTDVAAVTETRTDEVQQTDGPGPTEEVQETVESTEAPSTESATTDAPTTEDDQSTEEAAPVEPGPPPFQDPDLLEQPIRGVDEEGIPNVEEIPDPRPVGFSPLDQYSLGTAERYQNITPILNVTGMAKEPGQGVAAHSAASWHYWDTAGGGGELTLTVAMWDDSAFAMQQLVTGGDELRSSWLGPDGTRAAPTAQPWPGHEGDDDYFRTWQRQWGDDAFSSHTGVALIRLGDYLLSVSFQGDDGPAAMEIATQVAEQSAANLVALDPAHATDGGGR